MVQKIARTGVFADFLNLKLFERWSDGLACLSRDDPMEYRSLLLQSSDGGYDGLWWFTNGVGSGDDADRLLSGGAGHARSLLLAFKINKKEKKSHEGND